MYCRRYVILFFVLFKSIAFSQNLIYNGDFELIRTDSCPHDPSVRKSDIEDCLGWKSPNEATPDFFNVCDASNYVGVPINMLGYQKAYNGNGYGGFLAFEYNNNSWFEYLMSELITPLEKDTAYRVSFYVSCAEGYSNLAVEKLGALFTNSPLNINGSGLISLSPQFLNTNGPLKDTSNWMKVSGFFTAAGEEKFITIGYFGDSLLTDTSFVQAPFQQDASYYYVDSVELIKANKLINNSVTEKCDLFVPSIFSPNGDGNNDVLYVRGAECVKGFLFRIYNRWGELVFETNDIQDGWDGKRAKYEQNTAIFVYTISGVQNRKPISIKGMISLIK